MTELEALRERRSIRKYEDRPLDESVVKLLNDKIAELNKRGNLHLQLVLNERQAFKSVLAYGKFYNVANYIMIIGKKSETLAYRAGYYSEQLVLYAQSIGLRTCYVGLTYKKIKGVFELGDDEKILACISIGYGAEEGHVHKSKRPNQVSNESSDSPEWFKKGVEAALLAPTAINQQKFYFQFIPENKVRPVKGTSLVGYTKIDLGIAMYNFEVGAGRENFEWVDSPL